MDYYQVDSNTAAVTTFSGAVDAVTRIISLTIPLIVAITLVVFFWGIIRYVSSGGDEKKASEGKNFIIYGIVGLFVMVSLYGFVRLLINTFF